MEANFVESTWLKRFFSATNALQWDALSALSATPTMLEQVVPWIDFFSQNDAKVIVLPIFDRDGPCMWYAGATDPNSATVLAEELMAFVGPSYSNFRGQLHHCDLTNPIEEALHEHFGQLVFKLVPHSNELRQDIVRALAVYLGLLRRRPDAPDRIQLPFGKLRADFDRALLAGNEANATTLLEAMCNTGRVSAEQRKFFDIRLLAGLGRHQELAYNSSLLKAVMDLSLPPQTIVDLVDALYLTFIVDIENDLASNIAVAFERNISKHFGALFKERKGVRQANVLKAFFLYEATLTVPDHVRCAAIIEAFPEDPAGQVLLQQWSDHLLVPQESAPVIDLFESARLAVADEDYVTALALFMEGLPEQPAYSGLLRCAVELDPSEIARVLEIFDRATPTVFALLGVRDHQRLTRLRGNSKLVASASAPCDWIEWAQGVSEHRYGGAAIALLSDSVICWPVEDYLREPEKCAQLATFVGNADNEAGAVFRDAFPHFVEFFVHRASRPMRAFIPLYDMLIKMVAWNGGASADDLELVATLVQTILFAGPDKEIYADMIDDVGEILAANQAANNIDWALNLAEILAVNPAPDSEGRLRFFVAAFPLMRSNGHRMTSVQRDVLELLARDYRCEDFLVGFPEQTTASATKFSAFEGMIAIYTLTEAAGLRARDVLSKILPLAQVELTADSVATDRLRHLSEKADVFVFAWRSSKHQAYFCIKDSRGAKPLHMPAGKGSASILRTTLIAVEEAMLVAQ